MSKRKKFRRGKSGKSFALKKEDSEFDIGGTDTDDTPMDFEAQQTFTFDNGKYLSLISTQLGTCTSGH